MKTTSTPRTTGAAAGAVLTAALILTGCGTTGTDTDQNTQTEAITSAPEPDQDQVAAQVIDYYEQVSDLEAAADDGQLGEEAREFATYGWIDKHNSVISQLRQGGRTYTLIESEVVDHQIIDFNDTGSGDDPWTIRLNLCVESRSDYREEDGTVIDDPDEVFQSAAEVTSRYDGPNDVWKLTDFENGDDTACGHEGQTTTDADDSAVTTEEP